MQSAGENCMTPGLYAMVGAAAALGGVTRMTVSLVVIMFELTGSVNWIVPLMVAVMAAKWVGDSIVKQGVYDAHIGLNGYPFLDVKDDFVYTTIAADVMSPKKGDSSLAVLTQNSMSVADVENLLKASSHNGYPVIVSEESQYLVGFVLRKDLIIALTSAKESMDVFDSTKVFFNDPRNTTQQSQWNSRGPPPINLNKIVDFSPVTMTDQTPMEMVIDMFRKLGLRHVLVTHNGSVGGGCFIFFVSFLNLCLSFSLLPSSLIVMLIKYEKEREREWTIHYNLSSCFTNSILSFLSHITLISFSSSSLLHRHPAHALCSRLSTLR